MRQADTARDKRLHTDSSGKVQDGRVFGQGRPRL